VARGKFAPAEYGRGKTAISCVTGCGGEGSSRKLRASTWLFPVNTYPISNDAPDLIDCNAAAVEIISTIRSRVYLEPRLKNGRGCGLQKVR